MKRIVLAGVAALGALAAESAAFTVETTFAVEPAQPGVEPLRGSFALEGAADGNRRGIEVAVVTNAYPDCRVREFSFTLSCPRESGTPLVTAVNPADFTLPFGADAEVAVWHGIGESWCDKDHPAKNFTFGRTPLEPGETQHYEAHHGYPSSWAFPYFRVYDEKTGGGWTVALGYQGEWKIRFCRTAEGVRVVGGLKNVGFRLRRGETAIAPTVSLMAFDSQDEAVNGWRRFLRRHVLPRDLRTGGALRPLLALDPHEHGELYTETTAERLLEIVREVRGRGLRFDVLWVDAGWYTPGGYKKQTLAPLWWETVGFGLWKPDPKRFPKGMRPVSDELAKDGAKLLLWFEPERVHRLTPELEQVKRYCYDVKGGGGDVWHFDLAKEETVRFLSGLLTDAIRENGVGVYREDSNVLPGPYWRQADAKGRVGLAENFYVQGRRALWREIRRQFPDLLFDSVAAGGRRLDLATMAFPSVPLWYSDVAGEVADVPALQRCQHMLNQWIVYRRDVGSHRRLADGRRDWLRTVTCLSPMQTVQAKDFLRDDFCEDAKAVKIWRQVARLMVDGDYRLLTPETFGADKWWCCAFDDPETGCGFVQAARNAGAPEETLTVRVPGLKKGVRHAAEDLVSGRAVELGEDGTLKLGLKPGTGAIVFYRRAEEPGRR